MPEPLLCLRCGSLRQWWRLITTIVIRVRLYADVCDGSCRSNILTSRRARTSTAEPLVYGLPAAATEEKSARARSSARGTKYVISKRWREISPSHSRRTQGEAVAVRRRSLSARVDVWPEPTRSCIPAAFPADDQANLQISKRLMRHFAGSTIPERVRPVRKSLHLCRMRNETTASGSAPAPMRGNPVAGATVLLASGPELVRARAIDHVRDPGSRSPRDLRRAFSPLTAVFEASPAAARTSAEQGHYEVSLRDRS